MWPSRLIVLPRCDTGGVSKLASKGLEKYHLSCIDENFITDDVCGEVLSPSTWTKAQKAGELVTGIRNKVSFSPQHYSKLVEYLRGDRSKYGGIVDLLDREHQKQKQSSKCHGDHDMIRSPTILGRLWLIAITSPIQSSLPSPSLACLI